MSNNLELAIGTLAYTYTIYLIYRMVLGALFAHTVTKNLEDILGKDKSMITLTTTKENTNVPVSN